MKHTLLSGRRYIALLLALLLTVPMLQTAKAASGDGSFGAPFEITSADDLTILGNGSAKSPYEISSARHLLFFTERLNNNDLASVGKNYVLTNDIVLEEDFPGIDNFTGTLDGCGFTVSGLRIIDMNAGALPNGYVNGFIKNLSCGTVKNLTIKDAEMLIAGSATASGPTAGILIGAASNGATVSGCAVTGSLDAANGIEKAAGIVGSANASYISDCFFSGAVKGRLMPSGIVSYANNGSVIRRCIAKGDLFVTVNGGGNGSRGTDAGFIVAYPGNPTPQIYDSVAYGGSITYTGKTDGFVGRVFGYAGYNPAASGNIASDEILIAGEKVTGSDSNQNGADISQEALKQEGAYRALGWDFDNNWTMDSAGYPVPKYVAPLPVQPSAERITMTFHGDPKTGRGFAWYVPGDEVPSLVEITTDGENFENAPVFKASAKRMDGEFLYKAEASGLKPGTEYFYRIKYTASGQSFYTPVGHFKTATEAFEPFTFINLADTEMTEQNSEAMAAHFAKIIKTLPEASFMIHGGDFTANGSEDEWAEILDISRNSLMQTTLVPVAGEKESGNFLDHFNLDVPPQNTLTGAYYAFDYGNARFVMLNTNEGGQSGISDGQLNWLRNDVRTARANGAEWIVLSLHKGPYLTALHSGDADVAAIRSRLVPVIEELNIDLVLQGHDHFYTRTKYLKDGEAANEMQFTEWWNGKHVDYVAGDNGTFYLSPGSPVGETMKQQVTSEAVSRLFERSDDMGDWKCFAAVEVSEDRLTVNHYETPGNHDPILVEGFGIDKAVPELINAINHLGTDADVLAARAAYNSMTVEQRTQITNYGTLVGGEASLVPADKWMDASSDRRQTILIRNDTGESFNDAPVLVRLENIPSDQLKFYDSDGNPIPHDVETAGQNGVTSAWVRIPEIKSESVAAIWAYYGGDAKDNDPTAVWDHTYQLVEHFTEGFENGETVTDATGKQTGVVSGGYDTSVGENGLRGANFDNAKIQYGNVAGDFGEVTLSAIVDLSESDLSLMPSANGGIISKQLTGGNSYNTLLLGLQKSPTQLLTNLYTVRKDAGDSPQSNAISNRLAPDGESHLLTFTYDGMTATVFIDGELVSERFIEEGVTYSDPSVPLTIGAYSNPDSVANPFKGTIYEVWVTGYRSSPSWEAFRYSNYFGNAVTIGKLERNGDMTLIADIPKKHETLSAGLAKVYGAVSQEAELAAAFGDQNYDLGVVSAGYFEKEVPLDTAGETTLTIFANGAAYNIPLTVEMTEKPVVEALTETGDGNNILLSVSPAKDNVKTLKTEFFLNESIVLDKNNVNVYEGSTSDLTPENITVETGTPITDIADAVTPETKVTDGSNPYQIYEILLTEEQQAAKNLRFTWRGDVNGREVTSYVLTGGEWVKAGYAAGDGELAIDMRIAAEGAVSEGKLYVLILRAMTAPAETRTDFVPEKGQYDFTVFWNSDTQLMTQSYPDQFVHQNKYIAENYKDKKGLLSIHTGDISNRPYLRDEYMWRTSDAGYQELDRANIPYTVAWGNHDYDNATNSRIYYSKYFPVERFEQSDGTWTFGGCFDGRSDGKIDDLYYTIEKNGAKILLITLSYWMTSDDIDWAEGVVASHPDYSVILMTHELSNTRGAWSGGAASQMLGRLVDQYDNIKLALCGHIGGVGVGHKDYGDRIFYSVLSDYQGLPYGGYEFMRHIQFDIENGLVYFNTFSPMEHPTINPNLSPYGGGKDSVMPGLYQKNKDEFVLEIDFDGGKERVLSTTGLTLSTAEPIIIGTETIKDSETASVTVENHAPDKLYEWSAKLTDRAGNETVTAPKAFTFENTPYEPDAEFRLSTDAHMIRQGQYFTVNAAFDKPVSGNAAVVKFGYDTALFEYASVELKPGVSVLDSKAAEDGVTLTLMIDDYNAFDLMDLMLRAKEDAILKNADNDIFAEIKIVVRDAEGEKTMRSATGSVSFTTSGGNDGNIVDDGGDDSGKVTLLDLSAIIDAFGKNKSDPAWTSKYRLMDFNNNGEIDISDIVYIAVKI